jgi:hypothetical protein
MMTKRGSPLLGFALAAALVASGEPAGAISRAREQYLAAELAAARSRSLYLVLDPRSQAVDLKVDGFLLHRFAADRALLGSPWGTGTPVWPALIYHLTSDVPAPDREQIPIRPPSPPPPRGVRSMASPAGVEPPLGMPQDSLRQVPSRYLLHFEPDLDLTVVGQDGAVDLSTLLWRLGRRWREGWQVAGDRLAGRQVTPHLLLVMAPDEARRLFLSLRSDTRLLIAVAD